jgi:L-ascorbate metabolism protein UlaG (beta-lactamase superfamily)
MIVLLLIILLLVVSTYVFMRSEAFGRPAAGTRLARIQASAHWRDNQFQNLHDTPSLTEGASMPRVMRDFFFGKKERNRPAGVLPSEKIDLHSLDIAEQVLVWFGHSSYFMQLDGKKILVDPVFSGHASPFSFTTKSYAGADVYTTDDIPPIDILFITHDHWDHLDYQTIKALRPKIKQVITGMGTGAHLERWGYAPGIITEKDWHETVQPMDGFEVQVLPARHFSGRGFVRNRNLWVSFALRTPGWRIYIGGDSGYDTHFSAIGEQYGPFDLAILECGQYNLYWKYIHMLPEEVVQAAIDLRAKKLLPVHWAKFSLGLHAWDEPILRVTAEAERKQQPILHPLIGQKLNLENNTGSSRWWDGLL